MQELPNQGQRAMNGFDIFTELEKGKREEQEEGKTWRSRPGRNIHSPQRLKCLPPDPFQKVRRPLYLSMNTQLSNYESDIRNYEYLDYHPVIPGLQEGMDESWNR